MKKPPTEQEQLNAIQACASHALSRGYVMTEVRAAAGYHKDDYAQDLYILLVDILDGWDPDRGTLTTYLWTHGGQKLAIRNSCAERAGTRSYTEYRARGETTATLVDNDDSDAETTYQGEVTHTHRTRDPEAILIERDELAEQLEGSLEDHILDLRSNLDGENWDAELDRYLHRCGDCGCRINGPRQRRFCITCSTERRKARNREAQRNRRDDD